MTRTSHHHWPWQKAIGANGMLHLLGTSGRAGSLGLARLGLMILMAPVIPLTANAPDRVREYGMPRLGQSSTDGAVTAVVGDWLNAKVIDGYGQIGTKEEWKMHLRMVFPGGDFGTGRYLYTKFDLSIPLVGERYIDSFGNVWFFLRVEDRVVRPECHGETFELVVLKGSNRARGTWRNESGRAEEVWVDLR